MKITMAFLWLALAGLNHGDAYGQTPKDPWVNSWTVTIKVIGEDGKPIAGADASVQYHVPTPPDSGQPTYAEIKGITDENGVFGASHTDTSFDLSFTVEKAGYYTTHIGHQLDFPGQFDYKTVSASRNPTITLVLKKMGQPIAMYAKYVENGPPVFNEPVGYDLMVGDWVAPHGKGQSTDIIFTGKLDKKSKNDFDYELTVSFPNKGDGIQEFTVPEAEIGSGLRSPHEAPADDYQTEVVRAMSRHPGQATKEDLDLNRNYFFRVRTVLDLNGNVKSTLYGKIYGDFMQFRYYLNPTLNDRNVEFDPGHNLLGGLQSFERVNAP